ncbi:hypothetical protein BXT84_16005 [Sulfobacillus thermotolerans]|uniref:Glycosyltransferase 2-like domain-containing protein n=1 Tax=Sulfobacillus thermotolerans TaxID=338644 RepID=A0ABM6RVK4_9FIRM|nr:hypothetical protein BXT84_16005 [Sulfobacillus thermotolerans]
MEIWMITPRYSLHLWDEVGRFSYDWAHYQARQGHVVRVLTLYADVLPETLPIKVIPLVDNPLTFLASSSRRAWHVATYVLNAAERGEIPDEIHTITDWGLGAIVLQHYWTLHRLTKSLRFVTIPVEPLILTAYDNTWPRYRLDYFWAQQMEQWVIKASQSIQTNSLAMIKALGSPAHVTPLPTMNGDNVPTFFPPERLVMLGPVAPLTHIALWLEALSLLWAQGFSLPLEIYGPDRLYTMTQRPYREYLTERFSKDVERGHVRFLSTATPVQVHQMHNALVLHGVTAPTLSWGLATLVRHNIPVLALTSERTQELLPPEQLTMPIAAVMADAIAAQCAKNSERYSPTTPHPIVLEPARDSDDSIDIFPFLHPVATVPTDAITRSTGTLSVVIPYYNAGPFIFDAIDSVFQSRRIPDQVIIMDDGSTDPGSIAALYELAHRYPAVQVIHAPHGGIVTTRNRGAKQASGDILAFLDADDMVTPDYFARCVEILATYANVDFVGSWVEYFGDTTGIWAGWNPEPPYVLYHNLINSSGIVVRRPAFLAAGLNHEEMDQGLEDYESIIHLIAAGYQGVVIPEPLFRYRVRSTSRSKTNRHDEKLMVLYDRIRRHYPAVYARFSDDLLGLFNANGPQYRIDSPLNPPHDFIADQGDGEAHA